MVNTLYLKRKIDLFLAEWKNSSERMPLIINGAGQIGKTESVLHFAAANYKQIVYINFALEPKLKNIIRNGYSVEDIVNQISFIDPGMRFVPNSTLIVFDELQDCPDIATSLKSFKQDGRFDVICTGSLFGLHYKKIHSNRVGYKQDYDMYSMPYYCAFLMKRYLQYR